MDKEFDNWKAEEIVKMQKDIEYYEEKLDKLKMKMKIFGE